MRVNYAANFFTWGLPADATHAMVKTWDEHTFAPKNEEREHGHHRSSGRELVVCGARRRRHRADVVYRLRLEDH